MRFEAHSCYCRFSALNRPPGMRQLQANERLVSDPVAMRYPSTKVETSPARPLLVRSADHQLIWRLARSFVR
jgi:hypothetical protein